MIDTEVQIECTPTDRLPNQEIQEQVELISSLPFVQEFMDAAPNMSLLLNEQRQIIYANDSFLEFVGARSLSELMGQPQEDYFECVSRSCPVGMRPGDALNCIHALNAEHGCGTTPFCNHCGGAQALIQSQRDQTLSIKECRLSRSPDSDPPTLDLRVWAKPIQVQDHEFTLFSLIDISDEKRRQVLERIFFHDVLNTAGGMAGLAECLTESDLPDDELNDIASMLRMASTNLIEEITAQRTLCYAETGELQTEPVQLQAMKQVEEIAELFKTNKLAHDKNMRIDPTSEDVLLACDHQILRRILINLTKNAIEASTRGQSITLSCRKKGPIAEFSVHNEDDIPQEIQLQIFKRSFSTKGTNRGIGTYSIKLLTERYLNGKVTFTSNAQNGTTFTLQIPLV